jgi:hypothetical protein
LPVRQFGSTEVHLFVGVVAGPQNLTIPFNLLKIPFFIDKVDVGPPMAIVIIVVSAPDVDRFQPAPFRDDPSIFAIFTGDWPPSKPFPHNKLAIPVNSVHALFRLYAYSHK